MKQETSSKIQKNYIYALILIIILGIIFVFLISFQADKTTEEEIQSHIAIIQTNEGNITLELYDTNATLSTNRFIRLSKNGFYNGTIIHRVIPGLAIYGGQYISDYETKEFDEEPLPVESSPEIKHVTGTISFLLTSATESIIGCQFLICLQNVSSLDGKNSAFGKVIDGLNLIENISNYPNDNVYGGNDGRIQGRDVIINKITIITKE